MMNRYIVAATITCALIVTSTCSAAEQFLCVTDWANGFAYNKITKEWGPKEFRTTSKYIISKPEGGETAFVIKEVGSPLPTALCSRGFNDQGFLHCDGFWGTGLFRFNRTNGRFLLVFAMGYFNVLPGHNGVSDEGSDTPFMEIGKCSLF